MTVLNWKITIYYCARWSEWERKIMNVSIDTPILHERCFSVEKKINRERDACLCNIQFLEENMKSSCLEMKWSFDDPCDINTDVFIANWVEVGTLCYSRRRSWSQEYLKHYMVDFELSIDHRHLTLLN